MIIDLEPKCGLPITLNDDGHLEFHQPLETVAPAHRTLQDMRPYLEDPAATFDKPSVSPPTLDTNNKPQHSGNESVGVYEMYHDICLPQDEENFKKAGLRFDITVFHPGLLGKEFCKTAGHYHPFVPGTRVRYPETYEVILGNALFLMQRTDDSFEKVLEVYAIEVDEGEDVIFLPGFAHFLINPTAEPLITSNWSASNFASLYEPVAKYHGAAYYVIRGTDGKPEFKPNSNYPNIPNLKKLRPKELPQFGLTNNQPAYLTGQKSPDMLQFLNKPELYLKELTIENCYSAA